MRPDGTPDQLLGAIRNLSPRDFEQLTAELPDRWPAMLAEVGLVVGAPGTGVILKARWQNLPRSVRSELATALGAVADRLAASGEVSARIAALAAAFTAIAGQRRAPRSGPEPGVLAELLATATTVADATVEAAMAALSQGRPCPEDLPRAVREYNEAMAAARQLLADAGVDPLPEGRSAILAGLEEMAAAAAREPVRAAVAALAEVRSELAVLREARRRAAEDLFAPLTAEDRETLATLLTRLDRSLTPSGSDHYAPSNTPFSRPSLLRPIVGAVCRRYSGADADHRRQGNGARTGGARIRSGGSLFSFRTACCCARCPSLRWPSRDDGPPA